MKKLKKEMMGKLANGDDPMEPWSRKSNAPLEERSEQQLLVAYIRSLGYAPEFMTSSQKSAYARSKGFTQYKVSHDFVATNEAYVRKTAAQKIAAALQKQREKNKPYEAHQERMRQLDALMKGMKTEEEVSEVSEDLRKWFREKWVRMDTKGNIKGDCAREPGEGKPKCLPQAKAVALGKEGRAKAARRKRREDPDPDRQGAPINVKTESVDPETINEKNVPTSPEKWARAKSAAKSKFAVYPSAYANGWAAKKYKAMGGGWKSVSEEEEINEAGTGLLMTFIRAKGLDPLTMHGNQKASYSRSSEFRLFKRKHRPVKETSGMGERGDDWNEDSVCWPGYKRKLGTKKYTPGSCVKEDKYQDPHAATQTVGMEVEGKSRAFKAIKKLTKVNETTYDWEKTEKDNNSDKKQMTAKIIMKGGKTMTGQDRDTIQIDPIVRTKLDAYKSVNPNNNK